ncbi:MAG: hypothetical protein KAV87_26605 [Desulfobacteraceae bacterium]|nr:hypothetical protein [Desulfobacteraceae bacterium]
MAGKDRRSVSNFVRNIVLDWLEDQETDTSPKAEVDR